jgi:heme-degrading monooxygenase HmoA
MPEIRSGDQVVTQITVEALGVMRERARFMARQPGFVSITLHRSLDGQRVVNYIQWKSRELLEAAHKSPEFRKEWGHFDRVTEDIAPNLYAVAHVEGA